MRNFLLYLFFLCFLSLSAWSQTALDVLKLKNGNTLRGTVVKETFGDNPTITIDLGSGNILTLPTTELIERSKAESPQLSQPTQNNKPKFLSLWLGGRGGANYSLTSFGGSQAILAADAFDQSSKIGFSLELPVLLRLTKLFSLEGSLGYFNVQPKFREEATAQGYSWNGQVYVIDNYRYVVSRDLAASFVSIRALANVGLEREKFRFGGVAGFSSNILLDGKLEMNYQSFRNGQPYQSGTESGTYSGNYLNARVADKAQNRINNVLMSGTLGLYFGLKTSKKSILQVDARYNHSFAPIFEALPNGSSANGYTLLIHDLSLCLSYLHPISLKKEN